MWFLYNYDTIISTHKRKHRGKSYWLEIVRFIETKGDSKISIFINNFVERDLNKEKMHIKEFPKSKGRFIERGKVCRERTKPKKVWPCMVIAFFHLLLQFPLEQKNVIFN